MLSKCSIDCPALFVESYGRSIITLRRLQPYTRATELSPNEAPRPSTHSGRRGYVLVATSISVVFLLGAAGLAVDIGRMFITKNEAQAYVDSASLNAAKKLDGTTAGITAAAGASSEDTGRWQFDTVAFSNVNTKFGTSAAGPFTATPPTPPTNYDYVRVAVSVNLPMYLIRPFSGPTATVGAAAVASRRAITTLPSGVFPFSPYTREKTPDNAADPFGYRIGNDYTFRWGSKSSCGTDTDSNNLAGSPSIRGYCCVSNSASQLRQAIVSGQTDPVTIGQSIQMDKGAKNTEMSAIAMRVEIDTDTSSTTYLDYIAKGTGNGARVVVVPVNSGKPNYITLGFAGFFLLNDDYYTKGIHGNDSACAEYIGAWTQGVTPPTASGSGGYRIRLVQ